MPWTPPPGGVDAEHRNTRGLGGEYGSSRATGRVKNWKRSATPPGIAPRDRSVESPVQLERAGTVAIAAQAPEVAGRQDRVADVGELCRARIEEDDARRRNVRERADVHASLDAAAELPEVRGERAAD